MRIQSGQVFVNGVHLTEEYVPEENRDYSSWHDGHETVVPPEQYFVLGDHRNSSSDRRRWGWLPRDTKYAKAVFL